MKKLIFFLMGIVVFSCSSDEEEKTSNFDITVTADKTELVVSEKVTITYASEEEIRTLKYAIDGNDWYSIPEPVDLTNSLYFEFNTLGTHTISVKAIKHNLEEVIKNIEVDVARGNAVKITSIQIISFSNINNTWDSEYADTDVNRLADVFFGLQRRTLDVYYNTYTMRNWIRSTVKENQGDLTWDFSDKELYLNNDYNLRIGVADKDGDFNDDLLLGPPFEREFSLIEYVDTQPETVTISYPDIDFEMVLGLEW